MTLLVTQAFLLRWVIAFGLTLLLEAPVYTYLGCRFTNWRMALATGALASCITHPLLWFVWRPLFDSYMCYVLSGECAVIAIEAVVFRSLVKNAPFTQALAISLIANATSYGIGVLLQRSGIF
ncbi:MAG: hypothetical protein JXX14_01605 [Deltaproteobacteria bacterium]|nr:hypothetical protein [Deltaproteobacteria bacterium]